MSKQFCLIGHPLGHSISPEIHRRLMELSGVAGQYELREIDPEVFDGALTQLRNLDGFNVTIPYKQRILPYMDGLSERASRYGSVNTVTVTRDAQNAPRLVGDNTDVDGFLRALRQAGITLSGRVLLCGAGGVSRMMAYEALARGCALTVAARTISKSRALESELRGSFPDADVEAEVLTYVSGSFDVILNGTPAGMYPNSKECPVSLNVARSAGAVFDAVYNPADTILLQRARKGGARVQGGLAMLVWQAAAAQEIWTGAAFDPKAIDSLCFDMAEFLHREF